MIELEDLLLKTNGRNLRDKEVTGKGQYFLIGVFFFYVFDLYRSYDTSNYKHENKTKIFQIGIDRLTVIDTDGPGVIDVKFTRVSRCVQGVKHPNSFGFVARDPRKRAQVNGNTGSSSSNLMRICFLCSKAFKE